MVEILSQLAVLKESLAHAHAWEQRERLLEQAEGVQAFLAEQPAIAHWVGQQERAARQALLAFIAIEQGAHLLVPTDAQTRRSFVEELAAIDAFYAPIGGIVGYHCTVLELMAAQEHPSVERAANFLMPEGVNIAEDQPLVRAAVVAGIRALPFLSEIYPIGGAGERLSLIDEETEQPLPAAFLRYGGRTLLEGLIRDLQGREYLYYKLFGRQVSTPVVMMTSHEKENHAHVLQLCQESHWFGRPMHDFKLFVQPSVPLIARTGAWVMEAPLKLSMKPGGHGMLWRLAEQAAVFEWLSAKGRSKAIVRQINNPLAGVDHGLLAFAGLGVQRGKQLGFASCERRVNAAEGMDVVVERHTAEGYEYALTNIEYTEFEKQGIKDEPYQAGTQMSRFPSNTNILFVDLWSVLQASRRCFLPAMMVNMKSKVSLLDTNGLKQEVPAARLECMMQNIADYMSSTFDAPLPAGEFDQLKAFVMFNTRRKTLSAAKNGYTPGSSALGTPEGSFYDHLANCYELLTQYCQMQVPALPTLEEYLKAAPPFFCQFHPALGPLFAVIGQKIRGGRIAAHAELQLEIAELHIENLELQGSLCVTAERPLGHTQEHLMRYSTQNGKCRLRNVQVCNQGVDWTLSRPFWRNQLQRRESLQIILRGNAEFEAENVRFEGNQRYEVPTGHKLRVISEAGELKTFLTPLQHASWSWRYTLTADQQIELTLV